MKYFFFVLSFLMILGSAKAQTSKTDKILLNTYKKIGLEVKIKLNTAANTSGAKAAEGDLYLPEVITAYADTDSGLVITKDSVTYDAAGHPLVTINQVNTGSGFMNARKDSTVYVEGNSVTYMSFIWLNEEWTAAAAQYMEYNGQGLLERLIGEVFTPDSARYEMHYEYNGNGKVSEYIYYVVIDSMLMPQARYSFTYNSAGEITESLQQMTMGGTEWVNYSRSLYEYDETGFETLESYQLWEANDWAVYSNSIFGKNSAGLTAYAVNQYRSAGVLENSDSVSYTYDENGGMLTEVSSYWEEGEWFLIDSSKYAYDASGRLTMDEGYLWAETEWLKWSKTSYEYNEGGELLVVLTEQGTMQNTWENFSKVEYEYDNAGGRIKGESFVWDNSAWVNGNGDIEIIYDLFSEYYEAYLVEVRYKLITDPIGVEDDNINPVDFALEQNFPNPFNPETKISFSLPQSGKATLKIYDTLGREVAEIINGNMEKGSHTINFSGRSLSSGVYIYRLESGSFTESKKMLLLK